MLLLQAGENSVGAGGHDDPPEVEQHSLGPIHSCSLQHKVLLRSLKFGPGLEEVSFLTSVHTDRAGPPPSSNRDKGPV